MSIAAPIGMQFTGTAVEPALVLRVAQAFFEATPAIQARRPAERPAPGLNRDPPPVAVTFR